MGVFRRNLPAVIALPVGILLLVVPLSALLLVAETRLGASLVVALVPPASVIAMSVLLGAALYRGRGAADRVEWAVLAPAMVAGVVLAGYWNHVVGNLVWGPRDVFTSPGTPECAAHHVLSLLALSIGCAALAAWLMGRASAAPPSYALLREAGAVAILTAFSLPVRTASTGTTEVMGWGGIGATVEETIEGAPFRAATRSGFDLAAILLPCLLVALLVWRRADTLSRWRGIAVVSLWIVLDHWLAHVYRLTSYLVYDHWGQALVLGAVAGGLAILYGRLVVTPLWRRARGPGEGAPA